MLRHGAPTQPHDRNRHLSAPRPTFKLSPCSVTYPRLPDRQQVFPERRASNHGWCGQYYPRAIPPRPSFDRAYAVRVRTGHVDSPLYLQSTQTHQHARALATSRLIAHLGRGATIGRTHPVVFLEHERSPVQWIESKTGLPYCAQVQEPHLSYTPWHLQRLAVKVVHIIRDLGVGL